MKKYLVTHKKNGKTMLFTFDLNGFLIAFKTDLNMNDATVDYFKKQFLFKLSELDHYKQSIIFRCEEILQDLSFTSFWNFYGHKKGNKKRAERLWNALTEVQMVKAFVDIRNYKNDLILNPNLMQAYPETYLAQKRFDNE